MNRVFFSIGPLVIYWYSFLIICAVFIGYEIAYLYGKKLKYHESDIEDMVFPLVVFAIIGARIYYCIFNYKVFDSFIEVFQVWRGGLAIYGGVIGGSLYLLYLSIKKKFSYVKMLDILSLSLLLGQCIGRWGNFFNMEAYGGITTLDNLRKMHIPSFIINGLYIDNAYRIPTFLYESIWCFIGVIILLIIRYCFSYKEGREISFYFIWYGIGRFYIESLRSDSLYIGCFRISQIVSMILIILGFFIIFYKKRIR